MVRSFLPFFPPVRTRLWLRIMAYAGCWRNRLTHSITKQTFIYFGLCAKLRWAETANRETYPQGVHRLGTSLVGQWLRVHAPNAGCLGLIPGWGTRSRLPQLRVCRLQLKILRATMTHDRHSSRVEAKNPALLSNRDGYLLELTGWTQGSQAS